MKGGSPQKAFKVCCITAKRKRLFDDDGFTGFRKTSEGLQGFLRTFAIGVEMDRQEVQFRGDPLRDKSGRQARSIKTPGDQPDSDQVVWINCTDGCGQAANPVPGDFCTIPLIPIECDELDKVFVAKTRPQPVLSGLIASGTTGSFIRS